MVSSSSSDRATLLFTGVEGATILWEDHASQTEGVLARHDTLLRTAFADHGGRVLDADDGSDPPVWATRSKPVSSRIGAPRVLHWLHG